MLINFLKLVQLLHLIISNQAIWCKGNPIMHKLH